MWADDSLDLYIHFFYLFTKKERKLENEERKKRKAKMKEKWRILIRKRMTIKEKNMKGKIESTKNEREEK